MKSSPSRKPPRTPLDSPSDAPIEDKYYFGLSTPSSSTSMNNGSNNKPVKELDAKQPPPGADLLTWYKNEAARLHQHANLSQQRNQMLVQKVLAMRRQLATPDQNESQNNNEKDTGKDTKNNVNVPTQKGSSNNSSKNATSFNNASTTSTSSTYNKLTVSSTSTSSSSSPGASRLRVRELNDSPMQQPQEQSPHHSSSQYDQYHQEQQQGSMNDLAWTELKLQRSHHNFHALSKRTREVETSNAKAAQMIIDLRHEIEAGRIRVENTTHREHEGRALVTQLKNHVESLKKQNDLSLEKLTIFEHTKNEAEERATKWRKERREIGGYALRLEKQQEKTLLECKRLTNDNQTLHGELEETRGTIREMHGKMRAQAEHARLQLTSDTDIDPLHSSVQASVLALKRETARDYAAHTMKLEHELQDVRERLDETMNQLLEAQTRNEVLNVRATHAQRTSEEYREKSKKLQEILTSGSTTDEKEMSHLLSTVATLESQLIISKNETERCHVELTNSLSAMETARDRLLQSSESKEHVERQCEQLRQNVKDAESKARMLLTRLNVLNEDCLTSKKEIGSLQAENIHLEQQLMASQKKLSAAQQSEHTNVLTMKSIQERLNSAKKEVQESRSKVNQYEAKLHTADNEVYRAKTEMEEERRSTERIREQLSKLNQTQERTVVDIGNKHDNELKQLKAANNVLREQAARATTEALAAAASDDASVVQYKEEVMILKNKLNEKESEHHDVMEQLEQQHRQIIDLEKNNKTSYVQLKEMEETMSIKDQIFQEHVHTAEQLTKERDALSGEIVALQKALAAERNGTAPLFQHSSNRSNNGAATQPVNTATPTTTTRTDPLRRIATSDRIDENEESDEDEPSSAVARSPVVSTRPPPLPAVSTTPSATSSSSSSSSSSTSSVEPKPPPGPPPTSTTIPFGSPTTLPAGPPPPKTTTLPTSPLPPSVSLPPNPPPPTVALPHVPLPLGSPPGHSVPSPLLVSPRAVAKLPKGPPPTSSSTRNTSVLLAVPLPPGSPPTTLSNTPTPKSGEGPVFLRPPPSVADF